jgi:MATE family multidrug resistance protein
MTSFSLHRFTKGRNREILSLALPNISVPLLSSVDTAVVGHLREIYYLGAIAIGSMIFGFMVVFY